MKKIYYFLSFAFYPALFLLVCYSLPDNILEQSQFLNGLVSYFKPYINSLNHFELNARYPGQFQVAFLFSLFLMPIQCFFVDKSGHVTGTKEKVGSLWLLLSLLAMLLIILFYVLFSYGGHVDGAGQAARNMRFAMSSKIYFSLFSSLWLVGLSAMLVISYYHLKYLFFRKV